MCRYMGTSKSERYLYIILEYVTGGSIAGMIAQFGAFNEKLIKYVLYVTLTYLMGYECMILSFIVIVVDVCWSIVLY